MAALKARHNKWEARVRIPQALRHEHGGKELLYKTLAAGDRRAAKLEAAAWEVALKAEWATRGQTSSASPATLRHLYDTFRALAGDGSLSAHGVPGAYDELTAGIDLVVDRMAEEVGERELSPEEQAKLWALNDAKASRMGRKVPRRKELELTFREVADEHLKLWRIAPGRKTTNTEQQKVATFDLFASYFGDRPIRDVGRADASAFVDALRQLDPAWARTGKAKAGTPPPTWAALMRTYGGREVGLSDATVNRHTATLSALWKWAEEREYCDGRNPFLGHRRQLKEGRNKRGYVAWDTAELAAMFADPPKRPDLAEIMLVAMFSGMRLNEIASLTFGQIRTEGGVPFVEIVDAKTTAGERVVPLHSKLRWLVRRAKGADPAARVWPKFTDEGPGGKPGGDAGKEFSRYKAGLGFTDRRKVFHSFRKNFVGQLELARVPQNEVAQLVGHEKQGFTFGTYGTDFELKRRAEIVNLVKYPGVTLPVPSGASKGANG